MKVALVCIAKNEENYIEEWIDYHVKLGFDGIYVYQNDWRFDLKKDKLHKLILDGSNKQRVAYRKFVVDYSEQYDWIAFYDVDEFLVLKKHKTIQEFLSEYEDYEGVAINSVYFGCNGQTIVKDNNYSTLKRFTKRQIGIDKHIKCIMKSNKDLIMDVHNAVNVHNVVDTNKKFFYSGSFHFDGNDEIAQLNHYWVKTYDEFKAKCDRGRADVGDDNLFHKHEHFYIGNHNDIEDTIARDFLYGNN